MATYYVISEGQSNSGGKGTGGPDWGSLPSRFKVWNNKSARKDYPSAFVGNAWIAPEKGKDPFVTNRAADFNSISVGFCASLVDDKPSDNVRLIQHHKGGESIDAWASGGYMRLHMKDVAVAAGIPPATIDIWHQGEADYNEMDPAEWRAIMLDRITWYRANGVLAANSITLIGGIAPWASERRHWNSMTGGVLERDNPSIVHVGSEGLHVVKHLNNHFTGSSLWTFGQRYYRAWKKAAGA